MKGGTWRSVLQRFKAQRVSMVALYVLGVMLFLALAADFLASDLPVLMRYGGKLYVLPNIRRPAALRAHDNQSLKKSFGKDDWAVFPLIPYGPEQTQAAGKLLINESPGRGHLLGTDDVGRDVAAQLIHGARVALLVGVVSVLLYVLAGVLLGALGGYMGGAVDHLVNGAVAVMLTFPAFLLILVIRGLMSSQSVFAVMLVIAVTGWASVARLVRGEVLRILGEPYIEAARSAGASHPRILLMHVLPGAMGPVTVAATFGMAWAVLIESALSFLGLGPDAPSWGRLLASAQGNLSAWWLTLFPGLLLFVCVLTFNFVAEGIQNALDPHGPRQRFGSPSISFWPASAQLVGEGRPKVDRI